MTLADPSFNNVIVFTILLANLYFVYLTLRAKVTGKLALQFILLSLGISGWILFAHIGDLTKNDKTTSLLANRLVYAFLIITSVALLNFPYVYPKILNKLRKIRLIVSLLSIPLLLVTVGTDWFLKDLEVYDWGASNVDGDLFFIWAIYLTLGFLSPAIYLFKYKKFNELEKQRIKYFLLGIIILVIMNLFVHIVLSRMILKSDEAYRWGNYSTVFLLVTTGYSIIRYRLFGIRVIIGRTINILLLSSIPYISFYLVEFFLRNAFGSIYSTVSIITGLFLAILFSYFLFFANTRLTQLINKNIINKGYDPQEILENMVDKLSVELHITEVIRIIKEVLDKSIKATGGGVIIFDLDPEKFMQSEIVDFDELVVRRFTNKFAGFLLLVEYWRNNGINTVVREEFEQRLESKDFDSIEVVNKLVKLMKEFNIAVILPLNKKVDLRGAMFIGDKQDESPYNVQDIKFLENLVSYAGVAISRSELFEEVESYKRELEQKVEEATKELKEKVIQLEEAHKREQDMLDILGHELRTPLSIVKNSIGLMKFKKARKELTDKKFDEYIDKSEESLERELKLIETLLGATKLDARKLELNYEKCDMIDVIEDGLEGLKKKGEEKGLKVMFDKPKQKEIWGYADRTRIQEVFDNLLSNAIKYTDKGEINIKIDVVKEKTREMVSISIADTGRGISKKDQMNLGKKFYRAQQYSSDKGTVRLVRPGGTGLGLYVTFGLVRAMGGNVEVESELGKGSVFTFTIPKWVGQSEKMAQNEPKNMFKKMGLAANYKSSENASK